MFHTLRSLVPMQLQQQAVMIKRTFIERAESTPDCGSCRGRPRYFSDSAVLVASCSDVETASDGCSTVEAAEGAAEDGFADSDASGFASGGDHFADAAFSEEDQECAQEYAQASPRDAGELSWRHLRTMSFGDAREAAMRGGAWAPASSPGANTNGAPVRPVRSVRFAEECAEVESARDVGQQFQDIEEECAADSGDCFADAESESEEDEEAARASPRDDGELSWRHLRTMSFGDLGEVAAQSSAATAPPALAASPAPTSACSAQAVVPPQGQAPALIAAQAEQPAPAGLQGPQFVAVILPAMVGQCGAVVAAPVASMVAANPPVAASVASVHAVAPSAEATQTWQPAPERRTTVMLRNIPNNYTRERFLAMLDKAGLAGLIDFAYLPVDFRTGAALGYAFVNMVHPSVAPRLWAALDGFSRWTLPSKKRCSVVWNDPIQGLEANIERYKNSPIMHPTVPDSYKPIIFKDGVCAPYPAPTKSIKAPRLRK